MSTVQLECLTLSKKIQDSAYTSAYSNPIPARMLEDFNTTRGMIVTWQSERETNQLVKTNCCVGGAGFEGSSELCTRLSLFSSFVHRRDQSQPKLLEAGRKGRGSVIRSNVTVSEEMACLKRQEGSLLKVDVARVSLEFTEGISATVPALDDVLKPCPY